ncbi:hypothetical protein ACHQM5_003379 [Ranunculus cassubicifolius]
MEVPKLEKMPESFEDFSPNHSSDMDISDQSTPQRNNVENFEKVVREDQIECRRSGRLRKPNTHPGFVQGQEAITEQVRKRGRGRPPKAETQRLVFKLTASNKSSLWKSSEVEDRIVSPPTSVPPFSDPCGKSVNKANATLSPSIFDPRSSWGIPAEHLHNLPGSIAPSISSDHSPTLYPTKTPHIPQISSLATPAKLVPLMESKPRKVSPSIFNLHNLPGFPTSYPSKASKIPEMNSLVTEVTLGSVVEPNTTNVLIPETVPTTQNAMETSDLSDQIIWKVCDDISKENDDLYIIEDGSGEKSNNTVVFPDEKLNSIYNRISSRYGCLQGRQKVNRTVYTNLTEVLQVVHEMEMVDITTLNNETIGNWESAISVGKHLEFEITWLHDKLNELKDLLSNRPSLKEAMGNADERVTRLEKDVDIAKKNFELAKEKMENSKKIWESLDQEKGVATRLLDEATARYQKSNIFELNI